MLINVCIEHVCTIHTRACTMFLVLNAHVCTTYLEGSNVVVYIIKVNLKVIIRRVKEKEFVNASKGRCFNRLKY